MTAIGYSEVQVGALLTAILAGDLVITLYLSTRADGFGRRHTLLIGAALKVGAGVAFGLTDSYAALVVAGVIGVISTSGGECGPFQATEQAALTDSVIERKRRNGEGDMGSSAVAILLGWYNGLGYIFQALGALTSGLGVQLLQSRGGLSAVDSYRYVFFGYAAMGGIMAVLYAMLTAACEAKPKPAAPTTEPLPALCPAALAPLLPKLNLGLRRPESRYIVARLSAMFAMDAFGGAFVMQTWIAYWFAQRWGFDSALLGYLLMGANVVAGLSGIAAAYFVRVYGPMLTMIASHLPSNVLLLLVPFMPSGAAAAGMLVARFSISQMDVPARQAYVVMVVASDERSAAGGITNIVRSLGMSLSPLLLGYLSSAPPDSLLFSSPWVIAGVIKIAYDIILYALYRCDTRLESGEANARATDRREQLLSEPTVAAAPKGAGLRDRDADGVSEGLDAPLLAAEGSINAAAQAVSGKVGESY